MWEWNVSTVVYNTGKNRAAQCWARENIIKQETTEYDTGYINP